MKGVLTLCAASFVVSGANAVFYDSFDGTDIDRSKWSRYSERVGWIKNTVADSLLHVHGMEYPNGPDRAWIVGGGGDVWGEGADMRARVGWEDKQGQMMMNVFATTPYNSYAWITYAPGSLTAKIWNKNGNLSREASITIPRSGWETLRINRQHQFISVYFGEQLVVAAETNIDHWAYERIALGWFAQSEQTPMSYYADWAYVIPEPTSLLALAVGSVLLLRSRKRAIPIRSRSRPAAVEI